MKKTILTLLLIVLTGFCFSSCKKTCRCWHYNGSVTEYSKEELDHMDQVCSTMTTDYNFGLTYSLCEWVF